ncbi:MAG TPA: NAD(P)/FAD-dependent oxidoreductase [Solirubrobacteraceae bacterium]|nr:NAD(P)/FAD-dependent oxidoreductase [Solirubrobacteraceae bacterium]
MGSRIAVIGAGHHGLVAGIRLAEAGCEVTVLEASEGPGGGVRSEALTRPGYVHDTCAAFFPLALASPVLRELELDVEWVNPPLAMVHVTDEEGGEIALHRDLSATVESLCRYGPEAGRGWQELVETLWPQRERLVEAALGPMPPLAATAKLLTGLRARALDLAPMAVGSSAAVGRQLFGDDRAAAWLAGSGAHADVIPQSAGSAVFALGLNFLAHHVGWPLARGGSQSFTDALVRRLHGHGGTVRCGAGVEAIELSRRRATAVRLHGGERLAVDAVVATVSPRVLLRLLPPRSLPGRLERRLQGWRYEMGTLKLDWALSAPVPWRSGAAREAGVVHVGGALDEISRSLSEAALGRVPERPALVVGQQSLHDPTRAPDGGHTLYAYARVPPHPALPEADVTERVERQIERFAPGFGDLIQARSVRTPSGLEAVNASMVGGDLASGSCELSQQLIFRPDPRLCRGRTPLGGLYVAGAWVHPGPAVHGVSGARAADLYMRDRRRRRWPRATARWR